MDVQRRPGPDRGLKDAQGSACGVLRCLQAGIAGHAGAGRDDIAVQEVGHGYMIVLRLARVLGLGRGWQRGVRRPPGSDLRCSRVVAWWPGCGPARSRLMAENGVVAAGGRLTDWVSLGVLAASVPRDAADDAVTAAGRQAKRSDGKLPPHVVVYLVMAPALFA